MATTKSEQFVKCIRSLAWPRGTSASKWKYPNGAPKVAYKQALKIYMAKTSNVDLTDCGYFVNTVIRKLGIDKNFSVLPSSAKKRYTYSDSMEVILKGKKIPDGLLQPGDVIRYRTVQGSQHAMIYFGRGYFAEAGRRYKYPIITKTTRYNHKNVKKSSIEVLRVK